MKEKLSEIFNRDRGQVTLTVVLAILSTSAILVVAVSALTYNEIKKLNNIVKSAQSYYVAEGGIEDALLRLETRMSYSNSYTLTVGLGTAQVDITGALTAPRIVSRGEVAGRVRKVAVDLVSDDSSTNIAFNYGVQVGYGGLHMDNLSQITGNVYSNGPISSGPLNPNITGQVFAATGATATPDQANDSPLPPPNDITFSRLSTAEDLAQSFQVSASNAINRVEIYTRKQGNPGNLVVRIVNNSGGNPGSTVFAQGTLNADSVSGSYGWVPVSFSTNPQLNAGVTYWVVFDGNNNNNHYYEIGANTAYVGGEAKTGLYSGGPWSSTALDTYFKVYIGGTVGSIDGVDLGTGGTYDAHANTITNSTGTGTLFCQTGTDNNKPCDTSQPDPVTLDMPISNSNINQWKNDAAAGGTISGDYTPAILSSTLGPVKITGNLTIPVGYILTLTGTVYVQGYIRYETGAQIKLDTAYEEDSGLILSDGYQRVGTEVIFTGSGQAGSFIMILSTNDCNGSGSPTGMTCTDNNSAIFVANNSVNVVLYAHSGQLRLNQNADTKEATAYRLYLEENTVVTYESGLANAHFTAGPGAGYSIESWQEIF